MRNPDTTRALKLALDLDPICRVLVGKAVAYRHAVEINQRLAHGNYVACRTLRDHMRAHSREAVTHARARLSYYLQCVPRPEIAA